MYFVSSDNTTVVDSTGGDSGGPFIVPIPNTENKYMQIGKYSRSLIIPTEGGKSSYK